MRFGFALCLALLGCGRPTEKVSREDCSKVADHISEVIMAHFTSHPDELWDGMSNPHETGIPEAVTKASFKDWLATPEGKTWLLSRQGQVRSSAEAGIQPCIDAATPALVKCLLETKTREDVTACDKKFAAPAKGSAQSK